MSSMLLSNENCTKYEITEGQHLPPTIPERVL